MNKPVAIVTGASRGIGRGIAIDLTKTHTVIATYRGRKDAAESLEPKRERSVSMRHREP